MPLFFLTFMMIIPAFAQGQGLMGCGLYSFRGIPEMDSQKMRLALNKGTLSELILDVPKTEEQKVAPFLNLVTEGELEIDRVVDHRMAVLGQLSKLNYATLKSSPEHSYLKLKTKRKCK